MVSEALMKEVASTSTGSNSVANQLELLSFEIDRFVSF